jgi:hypothetical protein
MALFELGSGSNVANLLDSLSIRFDSRDFSAQKRVELFDGLRRHGQPSFLLR